jgi:hypothetical protein
MALTPQERKRKEKEMKRRLKLQEREPLALDTDKFRKPKLTPAWLATETAIYEAYVLADRKVSDQTVIAAIESLVRQMRAGPLPALEDGLRFNPEQVEEFLITNIRRNWAERFSPLDRPTKDDLIGVLRSILYSIQTNMTPGPRSQGYVHYIERFLGEKIGVSVEKFAAPEPPALPGNEP